MKDYYTLLSVEPGASTDEIKRAFRREIARYHPDKVHHLGSEFQALAAERAAELTEAYRVLMDAGLRASYDSERGVAPPAPAAPPPPHDAPAPEEPERRGSAARDAGRQPEPPVPPPPSAGPAGPPRPDAGARDGFVRRMSLTKFRDAVERALDGVSSMPARGFEASYLVKGKRSLFGKAVPERMMAAYVGAVTANAATELGQLAMAARGAATAVTVFALGDNFAPPSEIGAALTALKRKVPAGVTLTIVPLDVRDWTAMMPKEASASARAVVAQLSARD